jgi:ComF family protein
MPILKDYLYDFFNLLFPDLCCACARQLYRGEKHICTHCLYDLPYTDFHHYPENSVARLFWGRLNCHAAMAMLYFRKGTSVQRLMHQLKYKGQTELGVKLGRLLGERLQSSPSYQNADLLIPVPLHQKKLRSRGYNQSECIANGMAIAMRIPVASHLLLRQKATATQTRKSRYQRFENMLEVFGIAHPAELAGKHLILVDDVITTGATLEACGQLLLDHGAGKVSIVALAFAE